MHSSWASRTFGMIVLDIPEWTAELWMRSSQSVAINEESRDIELYCSMKLRWFRWNIKTVPCLCVCRFRVCPRTRALRQCLWCMWWRTRTCSSTGPSPAASSTSWRQSWWDTSSSTHLWSSPSVSQTSIKIFFFIREIRFKLRNVHWPHGNRMRWSTLSGMAFVRALFERLMSGCRRSSLTFSLFVILQIKAKTVQIRILGWHWPIQNPDRNVYYTYWAHSVDVSPRQQ